MEGVPYHPEKYWTRSNLSQLSPALGTGDLNVARRVVGSSLDPDQLRDVDRILHILSTKRLSEQGFLKPEELKSQIVPRKYSNMQIETILEDGKRQAWQNYVARDPKPVIKSLELRAPATPKMLHAAGTSSAPMTGRWAACKQCGRDRQVLLALVKDLLNQQVDEKIVPMYTPPDTSGLSYEVLDKQLEPYRQTLAPLVTPEMLAQYASQTAKADFSALA